MKTIHFSNLYIAMDMLGFYAKAPIFTFVAHLRLDALLGTRIRTAGVSAASLTQTRQRHRRRSCRDSAPLTAAVQATPTAPSRRTIRCPHIHRHHILLMLRYLEPISIRVIVENGKVYFIILSYYC